MLFLKTKSSQNQNYLNYYSSMPKLSPDEKWKRFNEKLGKFMKVNDFFGLAITYYEMADFLKNEGKDASNLRKIGYQMKLKLQSDDLKRFIDSDVIKNVEILATDDSCDVCKKLNHKVLSVREAQLKRPIPAEECTHKYGCRCVYLPVVE